MIKSHSEEGTGEFMIPLPVGREYALNVSKPGYMFYSENYTLVEDTSGKPYQIEVPLQPIVKGATVITSYSIHYTKLYESR